MPLLERERDVFILTLGATENRFHPDWMATVSAHLDTITGTPGPRALVTTAHGKFFSNGLDLEWLSSNATQSDDCVMQAHQLLARVLSLPVPSIAAVQGHAFGAGAMLALAHDFRLMRRDRGFFCLPEVDIDLPFTLGMALLVQGRLPQPVAHEAMTTGRRYGGAEATDLHIAEAAVDQAAVLPLAIERAAKLTTKAGPTLGAIKEQMYGEVLASLRDTENHQTSNDTGPTIPRRRP